MSDLISREDLIDWLTSGIIRLKGIYGDLGGAVSGVREMVKVMPSIEPEQKKGEWIDGMLYYDFEESEWEKVKCSVCKNFVVKQIFYHDNKYNFCPYCGADMRDK